MRSIASKATVLPAAVLVAVVLAACGGKGGEGDGNNNNNYECPGGFAQDGPACVPVFDDCPGPAEIAVRGGGCLTVGVTECATGFVSDGQGGCEATLPAQPCPSGTMEVVGETDCQPVGVVQCAAGFASDGEGGCDAILPQGPCPSGSIEALGETTCQPLGDCGTGTWGNIPDDPTTVYVDGSYGGGNSDGSQAAPFVTVVEALAAVQSGGRIGVAAGEYVERVTISKQIELVGRCAELVTLRGTTFLGEGRPPVTINTHGSGTEIRGVTLTGPGEGLTINGATGVTVTEVQVFNTGNWGIFLSSEAEATVSRVVVDGATDTGIRSLASTLHVIETVSRDAQPDSSGFFGRGIEAWCEVGVTGCGSLTVERSLVELNRELGIVSSGADLSVVSTVVRDTRGMDANQRNGTAIKAQCNVDLDVCPTMEVTDCVVERNRDVAIVVMGADADVTSTVIRDTLSRESDRLFGRGIEASCDERVSVCGSLNVAGSFVEGNREVGIAAMGIQAGVVSTLVQDTLAREGDGTRGFGIWGGCDPAMGVCSTLIVDRSLVLGNTERGIVCSGAEAVVTSSVVRNTLPDSNGDHGLGVSAFCDVSTGQCGWLRVEGSLVDGNSDVGIGVAGVDTSVMSTVVRDTVTGGNGLRGYGVGAQCDVDLGTCGSLSVAGCVIEGNSDTGLISLGVDTDVTSTVIQETLARGDQTAGYGIGVQCSFDGQCGTLSVTDSLLSRNRSVGIYVWGTAASIGSTIVRDTQERLLDDQAGMGVFVSCDPNVGVCGSLIVTAGLVEGNRAIGVGFEGTDATVVSTVVRDTLPQLSDEWFGRGINAQCDPYVDACGSLTVTDSLVTGNTDTAFFVAGVPAIVEGTAILDTRAVEADGTMGRGIGAQCDPDRMVCGSLGVANSLVGSNRNIGIFIGGVPTTLLGVAVKDTLPNEAGLQADRFGQGIAAVCDAVVGSCPTLEAGFCLLGSNYSAGLMVQGVTGFIESSVIHNVVPRPVDDAFGYGIQIEGLEGPDLPVFDVISCQIADSHLAGILFVRATGTVSGSTVSGGMYAVVANVGSQPDVASDNDLSGTVQDGLFWGNMDPCPAPAPSLPVGGQ